MCCDEPARSNEASDLAAQLGLPLQDGGPSLDYCLCYSSTRLELRSSDPAFTPVYVDFTEGATAWRLSHSSSKDLLGRAVGLRKHPKPYVIDATAGLGRDAALLATLGCRVTMFERSPIIAALLADGLNRAREASDLQLALHMQDTQSWLDTCSDDLRPDVICLDPMFPERRKSALVKKEMRFLKDIVGDDADSAELLAIALKTAKRRVVVKRSKHDTPLGNAKPGLTFAGASVRYDVYLTG